MRHFKRLAVIMLVVAMILSTAGIASAALSDVAGTRYEESVEYLRNLKVVAGYPDGTFKPEATITRAEAAKIIIVMKYGSTTLADLLKGAVTFSDVPGAHWASGFIALAKNAGIVNGYPDGTFKPEGLVTYAEFAKMLVEAAGLTPLAGLAWPANYVGAAQAAGMLADVPLFAANSPATRGDCAIMAAYTVQEVENPTTGKTLAQSVFGHSAVASVTLTPATQTVGVGTGVQFVAIAKDADGAPIADAAVTYTTSDATNSAVNQNGLFVAAKAGVYTVTAKADDKTATATVAVYGAASALKATASMTSVAANGTTKISITVAVIDANGTTVANDKTTSVAMGYGASGNNGAVTLTGTTPKTVTDGVATFEVTASIVPGRTDTVEFTSGTLTKGSVAISSVAQVATSITLAASPSAVTSNTVTSSTVTATVKDQGGEKMLTGLYELTFSVSGKGTFAAGSTTAVKKWTSLAQASDTVYSVQGDPGVIVVSVTGTGLASGSVSINSYIAGAPKSIKVEVSDSTIKATDVGGDVAKLKVVLVDFIGQPTTNPSAAEAFTLTLSNGDALSTVGLAASGAGTLVPQGQTASGEIVIGASAGNAGKAGTHTIKVTPATTGLGAVTFDVVVTPGTATTVSVTPATNISLPMANPTVTLSVQLTDAAGNTVPTADVTVKAGWTDVGGGNIGKPTINGVFNPPTNAADANAVSAKTNASGVATFTFAAQGYVGDNYSVQFVSGAMNVSSGTITLVNQIPASFAFGFQSGAATVSYISANVGEVATMTVTVKDAYGNAVPNWKVDIQFSEKGKNVQTAASAGAAWDAATGKLTGATTLANGTFTVTFLGKTAGSYSISATAQDTTPSVIGTTWFTTMPGLVVAKVVVQTAAGGSTTDLSVTANTPVELRVYAADNGGNVIVSPGDTKLNISANGLKSTGAGTFRYTSTGADLTTDVKILKGSMYRSLWYVQGTTATVTVSITANDAAFVAYVFDPAVGAPVGTNPCVVTFTVKDGYGTAIGGVTLGFTKTGAGTLSAATATTAADGTAAVTLTGGAAADTVTATVTGAVLGGGVTGVTAIATVP